MLESAMQASIIRNNVIQNNIANADVPNFKKKSVVFDRYLSDAIDLSKKTGKLDVSNVKPKIITINSNLDYRTDGNNVDMELEMMDLYTNSIRFDTMQVSAAKLSSSLNLVLGR